MYVHVYIEPNVYESKDYIPTVHLAW